MGTLPIWLQIIITLLSGGFFGSIVSLIVSPIAARQQIKQLEITYRYKLNDNLLENAKQYRDTLYIPINKCLSKIDESYEEYKTKKRILKAFKKDRIQIFGNHTPSDKVAKKKDLYKACRAAAEDTIADFQKAASNLTMIIQKAIEEGNDTYLPIQFDNHLHSFLRLLNTVHAVDIQIKSAQIDIESTLYIDDLYFRICFRRDMRDLKAYIKAITQGTASPGKQR